MVCSTTTVSADGAAELTDLVLAATTRTCVAIAIRVVGVVLVVVDDGEGELVVEGGVELGVVEGGGGGGVLDVVGDGETLDDEGSGGIVLELLELEVAIVDEDFVDGGGGGGVLELLELLTSKKDGVVGVADDELGVVDAADGVITDAPVGS